ncbi:MAG TPA: hypothetical protein VIK82_04240 [Porticoccaceae bacterium]
MIAPRDSQSSPSDPAPRFYPPFRAFSFLVLLLIAAAIAYALGISIYHWSGIGV